MPTAFRLILAAASLAVAGFAAPAAAQSPQLRAVPIGIFAAPVHIAVAPGFPNLLFVVERAGQIRVMRDEVPVRAPFLDIREIVRAVPDPDAGGEEGLLSVAFPPDYKQSGRFYVAFTNKDGDIELDEFRRSPDRPARADPGSRRKVLVIPHRTASNHNGGQLQFGPSGLLYLSTGDGGAGTPIGEPARRLDSLLGKIVRIDPVAAPPRRYRIPPSNPFVGKRGRDEIFAYGLRNPWRFSITGRTIAIADVGQLNREEVNILPIGEAAGANFGWPQYEGDLVFDASRPGRHPATFPMFVYGHDRGCAITGGFVVTDPKLPALRGRYLYGDFCEGDIHSFLPDVPSQTAAGDASTGLVLPGLTSFGRGVDGQLYAAQVSGQVSRLERAR